MGNLIKRKRAKAFVILGELGDEASEASFAELFKKRRPDDWTRIELEVRRGGALDSRRLVVPDTESGAVYVRDVSELQQTLEGREGVMGSSYVRVAF